MNGVFHDISSTRLDVWLRSWTRQEIPLSISRDFPLHGTFHVKRSTPNVAPDLHSIGVDELKNGGRMLAVILASTILSLLVYTPAPFPAQERSRPPIIDMHLHADLPPEEVPAGAPSICRPDPCRGEGGATSGDAETLERTLEAMKRYNIVNGFVSGLDLDVVQKWVKAAPDRVIGSPFILKPDPHDLKQLRQASRISRSPKNSTSPFSFTQPASAHISPTSARLRDDRFSWRTCSSVIRSCASSWRTLATRFATR
jgi:hypothetical protein